MHPDLEKLIFKSNTIPSLPAVYKKIREAVEDPDSTIEDIARIVCNDQALSARLLRLSRWLARSTARSSAYASASITRRSSCGASR